MTTKQWTTRPCLRRPHPWPCCQTHMGKRAREGNYPLGCYSSSTPSSPTRTPPQYPVRPLQQYHHSPRRKQPILPPYYHYLPPPDNDNQTKPPIYYQLLPPLYNQTKPLPYNKTKPPPYYQLLPPLLQPPGNDVTVKCSSSGCSGDSALSRHDEKPHLLPPYYQRLPSLYNQLNMRHLQPLGNDASDKCSSFDCLDDNASRGHADQCHHRQHPTMSRERGHTTHRQPLWPPPRRNKSTKRSGPNPRISQAATCRVQHTAAQRSLLAPTP